MKRWLKIVSSMIVVAILSGCAIQQAVLEKQAEDRQAAIDAQKAQMTAPVKPKKGSLQTKSITKTKPKPKPSKPKTQAISKTEEIPKTIAKIKAEPKTIAKAKVITKTIAKTIAKTKAKPKAIAITKSKTKTVAKTKLKAKLLSKSKTSNLPGANDVRNVRAWM